MKDTIKVVILPLYRSNMVYPYDIFFQYKNNINTLDLYWLEHNLTKLYSKYNISDIYIEGGEISLLSEIYFDMLFNLIKNFDKKINITTNFLNYNKSLINQADIINVNLNFNNLSENSKQIKDNIKAATSIGKIINIKSLDISIDKNQLEIITSLNRLNIKSWEILPFYPTITSNIEFSGYDFFENIVLDYMKLQDFMKFSFINSLKINKIIKNDNFPTKTVYITPNNKFGLGIFNKDNLFEIIEFDNVIDLEKNLNFLQNQQILLCKECKHKTNCLADRYFNPKLTKNHCSGFKNLIKSTKDK